MLFLRSVFSLLAIYIIIAAVVWLVFGWLYGPNPSVNTLPELIRSYGRSNRILSSKTELVAAGGELDYLMLPSGFSINTFAANIGGPNLFVPGNNWGVRQMTLKGETIYATVHKEGKVVAIQDTDANGVADKVNLFAEGLSLPHGIEAYGDWIYIAQNDKILRIKDSNADGQPDSDKEDVTSLPPFLEHWTRTVRIFDDPSDDQQKDYMFVSIGSSCNGCIEVNPQRASIIKCETDGKDCRVYASGLRNSVDFGLYQGKIFATDVGRDFIGNDIPPEEINIIKDGGNYGWPYCYGKQVHDTTFDRLNNPCPSTEGSFSDLPAHSTALGVTGYQGQEFPSSFQNQLFVALHGSYQSRPASGYQIVTVNPETGDNQIFIDGFVNQADGKFEVRGRPVHILNYQGGLLISDDQQGKIYFVRASQSS